MSVTEKPAQSGQDAQHAAPSARHLVVIGGPTAVGKTAAAIAVARRFGGEVVSADSRQVYRGMDIGTAKPTGAERDDVPHHLIDILDPDEDFSLASYVALARGAIDALLGRGRLPILAGGTPLYLNAVTEGWRVPHAPPNPALRAELEAEAAREGLAALERRLAAVDPVAAGRATGNLRRVVRALEVFLTTGVAMSAQEGKEMPPYCIHQFVLTLDRAALHARIDARVERMIAAELVDEVRGLLERGYAPDLPAMSGIGYAEIVAHLGGECTLPEAIERIKFNTHRYVRHQETWFRRNRAATRVDVSRDGWLERLIDEVGTVLAGGDS